MSEFDFDLFVIGAGSGGVRLARMSAASGAKVAVAEDRYLGGTCVNVGCVPKKLFVYASHVMEELEDGEGFGWSNSGDLNFDWPTLCENKNKEIGRLNGIYQNLLENSGAKIINGSAKLVGPNIVQVGDQQYTSERIVVATGGWPRKLNIPGNEHIITSNEFFYLDTLPKSAVVQGGGYIAIELAGILNGLGVDTTVVFRGEKLLRGFDEEIRDFVAEQVQNKGIKLISHTNIDSVTHCDDSYQVYLSDHEVLQTDLVLTALGRVPKVDGLGLEDLGVELKPNGAVCVNDDFQTSVPSVYAIGDVIDRVQLTPVALAEGMYLSKLFFADKKPSSVDYENIPTAVFCQPNIGTVGLTEEQARESFNVDVYASSFKPMKHTMSGRNERSMMKLIVDKDTDKVLGAHMVGPDSGEIIQGIAIAIKAGATKSVFDSTIGIHPTAAEEFVTMRQAR
ncbi:glutathione-disulfide reductase [Oleiphilus sp. HI0125]|uniref:glutathione-disulfide reductase n=2 Tax=Oleiphilus sp. HI0125 TaxID=1822266 RepID=UPI0007C36E49|nr:glutathione-disulfide reductase [Oleiphilus sp. HI0125]KZZ61294.1 glutathione-disulfide reductase [Oleiphilus sp. HI0125]